MSCPGLIAHFFWAHPLSEYTTGYLFIHPQLGYFQISAFIKKKKKSCYMYPCASICVDISFQFILITTREVFPGGSEVKESTFSAGDLGSIPELGRSLEKEVASHSSILAWRIPWWEEPGRLQPMGSQRVRHNWATSLTQGAWLLVRVCVVL